MKLKSRINSYWPDSIYAALVAFMDAHGHFRSSSGGKQYLYSQALQHAVLEAAPKQNKQVKIARGLFDARRKYDTK